MKACTRGLGVQAAVSSGHTLGDLSLDRRGGREVALLD